jgi:hypothetical protein
MGKHQPALLGGLFIGVLSSLPFVNIANCCCLWVLGGGMLVVYLQQQNTPMPVQTSDAAVGGLIAGAVGGLIVCLVNMVFMSAASPMMLENMRSQMSQSQMPPQAQQFIERMFTGQGLTLIMFVLVLPLFSVFGLLGSLLGLAFFRKKMPPQAPPPMQPPTQPPMMA